jgi:hypothetical protein
MSIQRNIGVFVVVLGILVGGTWATVKITTDYLLYQTRHDRSRLAASAIRSRQTPGNNRRRDGFFRAAQPRAFFGFQPRLVSGRGDRAFVGK